MQKVLGTIGIICAVGGLRTLYIYYKGKQNEAKHKKTKDALHTVSGLLTNIGERLRDLNKKWESYADSPSESTISAYYHFDSNGNKLPNKWDTYNVDEELKKLEDDAKETIKPSKLSNNLDGIEHELEAILAFLDSIRGDHAIRLLRRELVVSINQYYLKELDALRHKIQIA